MAKKKIYTAAVIGCGRIGYSLGLDKKREQPASHTMALKANKRIQIIAGCDKDINALNIWKAANPKAIIYTDSANLYARQRPDIIVVAVNEESHMQEALAAIKNMPKLVILEKPVALNQYEAFEIQKASEHTKVPVLVNHERRFAEDYNLAKNYMDKIGDLQSIDASLYSGLKVYSSKEEKTGAYSLLHDGTHLIDIVLFLLEKDTKASQLKTVIKNPDGTYEEKPKEQTEQKSPFSSGFLGMAENLSFNRRNTPKEIIVNALLNNPVISGLYRDEEGTVRNLDVHYANEKCPSITISLSGRSKYFGFEIDIHGTTGRICIGNGYLKYYTRKESKLYTGFYSLTSEKVKVPKKTRYFANMVQNAVDFLDGKAELKSSINHGMNAMSVIEEILDAIKQTEKR